MQCSYFCSFTALNKPSGTVLSVQETRHCEWGNRCKRGFNLLTYQVLMRVLIKRALQTWRRKAKLRFIFTIHFRQESSETNLVWNSFVSMFIHEQHWHIPTGSGEQREGCIHIHIHIPVRVDAKAVPGHGCKEGKDSAAAPAHKNTLQHILDSQAGSGHRGIASPCAHKQSLQPPCHRVLMLHPQSTISPLHGLLLKSTEAPKGPVQSSLPLWAFDRHAAIYTISP